MNATAAQTVTAAQTIKTAPSTLSRTDNVVVFGLGGLQTMDLHTYCRLLSFGVKISDMRDVVEVVEAMRFSRHQVEIHVDDMLPCFTLADHHVSRVVVALAKMHNI